MISLFNDQNAKEVRGAVRVNLSHTKQLSQTVQLSSRLYADYVRQGEGSAWSSQYWCAAEQIDGCNFSQRYVSRWIGLEQQLRYEPVPDSSLSNLIGYDVRLRDGSGRPADYRDLITGDYPAALQLPYFNEQSVLGALFLQQIWSPVRWFTLNLGARLDLDSLFGAHPSPRVAVVLTPVDNTSLRASYSEAFRGPTASELYASDATYIVAPEKLSPEVVRTAELEWQQRFLFVSFSLRGWVAFYDGFINQRTATEDEVMRGLASGALASTVTPDYVVVNDNVDQITAYGGTLTLQARPTSRLSFVANVTVSHTESPGLTEYLWPVAFGNLRAAYTFAPDGATLALASTYAVARNAFNSFANNANTAPAVRVHDALDLRLTFASPIHPTPGLRVRAAVGGRVFPDEPYVITGPTETVPDLKLQFSHERPSLYFMLGVGYDL
jgi:outer membrane receptor protein involved in Fe transport